VLGKGEEKVYHHHRNHPGYFISRKDWKMNNVIIMCEITWRSGAERIREREGGRGK